MKLVLGNACLFALMVALMGAVHAATTREETPSTPSSKTSQISGKADNRVSGQGSAGGMQLTTPGGNTGNTAGSARPPAQGSSGGRQSVTPAGGANYDPSAEKSRPASE
jgi:hypothetical protein